ncbi:MAG: Glu/Leu/Phe/Val dehydrogenase dimerization domain-containing protein, partial [Cyclobacteriaceae bacterium]
MKELLKKFEQNDPEIVFEWKDPETEAEGWVVINSLRGGAAGGGTRMRVGLDKYEVISLAKTMEVKFTVSGPPIGGAKSGINFDPRDPRKKGVLYRWFSAVKPLLKYYYGTGGDLNVDEIHEVIPITEDVGVWHPQEGVFNGHYQPREAQMINRIGQLRLGVIKVIEDERFSPDITRKYQLSDSAMITAEELEKRIWDLEFEVFIPAAASRLITRQQVDRMISSKLEVFSCGANVPFADPEIFFGPTGLYADENFSVIPDFIANCGMARVFAYLMEREV